MNSLGETQGEKIFRNPTLKWLNKMDYPYLDIGMV